MKKNKAKAATSITQYILECDLQAFKKLIDVCSDISERRNCSFWKIIEGLEIAFNAIFNNKDWYVDAPILS
ncbi:MAG: hypothetical protein ACLR1D_06480 [Dialister sp.]